MTLIEHEEKEKKAEEAQRKAAIKADKVDKEIQSKITQ
jgi:hypothetical protein